MVVEAVVEEAVALYQFSVPAVMIVAAHGVSAVAGILQALQEVVLLLLEVLNPALLRAKMIQQAAKNRTLHLRLVDQDLHHNHQPAPAALAQVLQQAHATPRSQSSRQLVLLRRVLQQSHFHVQQ